MTESTRKSTSVGHDGQDTGGTVARLATRRAALHLSVALAFVVVAVVPAGWSGVVPLVPTFLLLSCLPRPADRAVGWVERRGR